jgi:hypothetical protein
MSSTRLSVGKINTRGPGFELCTLSIGRPYLAVDRQGRNQRSISDQVLFSIFSKFCPAQICYLRKVLHAHTTNWKRWCQRESLLTQNFKMFYLLNDNSDLKSVFTSKSVSTRSSKLTPMLIRFDKLFIHTKSYQPLYMWIINPFVRDLSMVNARVINPKR